MKIKIDKNEKLRSDRFVRFDVEVNDEPLYGVGCINSWDIKRYFLNCYRKAPLKIRIINQVGFFKRKMPRVSWCGSLVDPMLHWKIRVWKNFFVGGDTPKFILKLIERFTEDDYPLEERIPYYE